MYICRKKTSILFNNFITHFNALFKLLCHQKKIESYKDGEVTDIEDLAMLEKEIAALHWDMENPEKALSVIDQYLKENPENLKMLNIHLKIPYNDNCGYGTVPDCHCQVLPPLQP